MLANIEKGGLYLFAIVGMYLVQGEYSEFKSDVNTFKQELVAIRQEQVEIKDKIKANGQSAVDVSKKLDREMLEAVHVSDTHVLVRMPPRLDSSVVKLVKEK